MPASASDLEGQVFGQYELTRLLAQSEHSTVYLGKHITLGNQTAIRLFQSRLVSAAQESFLAEIEILKTLNYPHLVKILDGGVEQDTPFLVMAYAGRSTLHKLYPPGTRLRPATVLSYVKQAAAALYYLHQHEIIHHAVRPEHLLLNTDGTLLLSSSMPSVASQSSRSYDLQDMAGSITYMAPEQLRGKAGPASDQYALGIVVYEWLSGAPPFQGSLSEVARQQVFIPPPTLENQLPDLHPAINEVVLIALSKNPKQRFAHMQAFAYAFEQACQSGQPQLEGRTFFVPDLDALLAQHKPETSDDKQATSKAAQTTDDKPASNKVAQATEDKPTTDKSIQVMDEKQDTDKTIRAAEESHQRKLPAVISQPQSFQASSVATQQTASQQTTSTVKPRPSRQLLLLSVLAVLVVLSSSGLFYLIARPPAEFSGLPQSPNEAATSQARSRATTVAGAYVRDESTAEALGNAAATPTAAARIAFYQQALQGKPVIDDPLQHNTNNRWEEDPLKDGFACIFKDGTYHIIVTLKNTPIACFSTITGLSSFALQVQMTILKGDYGGIDFYSDSAYRNKCTLGLSNIGTSSLICRVDYLPVLQNYSRSSLIKKSPQPNVVTIIARKGVVSVYINASYIGSFTEDQLTSGDIVLNATEISNNTDVSFSHLKVWKL